MNLRRSQLNRSLFYGIPINGVKTITNVTVVSGSVVNSTFMREERYRSRWQKSI
jgi:hypothetical protein